MSKRYLLELQKPIIKLLKNLTAKARKTRNRFTVVRIHQIELRMVKTAVRISEIERIHGNATNILNISKHSSSKTEQGRILKVV